MRSSTRSHFRRVSRCHGDRECCVTRSANLQAQPVQYQPNPAKFDGRTTSGDTYTAKPIIREQPAPLRQGPPSPAFDARSTSQEDYGAKPLPPRPVPAQQPRWESSGQFYGETESQVLDCLSRVSAVLSASVAGTVQAVSDAEG